MLCNFPWTYRWWTLVETVGSGLNTCSRSWNYLSFDVLVDPTASVKGWKVLRPYLVHSGSQNNSFLIFCLLWRDRWGIYTCHILREYMTLHTPYPLHLTTVRTYTLKLPYGITRRSHDPGMSPNDLDWNYLNLGFIYEYLKLEFISQT